MRTGTETGKGAVVIAGLGLCSIGAAGLLYNLVLLTTHFWWVKMVSSVAVHVMQVVWGQSVAGELTWLAAVTAGAGTVLLTWPGVRQETSHTHGAGKSRRQLS